MSLLSLIQQIPQSILRDHPLWTEAHANKIDLFHKSPWFEKSGNIEAWKGSELFKALTPLAAQWRHTPIAIELKQASQWNEVEHALTLALGSAQDEIIHQLTKEQAQAPHAIHLFLIDQAHQPEAPITALFYQRNQQLNIQNQHIHAQALGFTADSLQALHLKSQKPNTVSNQQFIDEIKASFHAQYQANQTIPMLQSLFGHDALILSFEEIPHVSQQASSSSFSSISTPVEVNIYHLVQRSVNAQLIWIDLSSNANVKINEFLLSPAQVEKKVSFLHHHIKLAPKATLVHHRTQAEDQQKLLLSHIHADIEEKAHYTLLNLSLGADQSRLEINTQLLAPEASCDLGGLSLAKEKQQMDLWLNIQHLSKQTHSAQQFKNIIGDQAKSIFTGKVLVAKGASQCEAEQNNANLLLNSKAKAYSRPQLEIYNHDVKCSHGATVAQIDEDALFYINARGLSKEIAQQFLTSAFAMEIAQKTDSSLAQALVQRSMSQLLKLTDDFSLDVQLFEGHDEQSHDIPEGTI